MDEDSAAIFDCVREEAVAIHLRWKLYGQLYVQSKEDVLLLSSCGGNVFGILQELLLDDCILRICRLTDRLSKGSQKHRSVSQLVHSLEKLNSPLFAPTILQQQAELDRACSRLRKVRNARIAHADLGHSLNVSEDPLPDISVDDVNKALELLSSLLNSIEEPFRRSHTNYFDALLERGGDAERLLSLLRTKTAPRVGPK